MFPSIVNAGGKEPPYATRNSTFLTLEKHNFSKLEQYLNIIYKLKALKLKRARTHFSTFTSSRAYILSFLFPSIGNAGGKEPPYATNKLKALKLKRVGTGYKYIYYYVSRLDMHVGFQTARLLLYTKGLEILVYTIGNKIDITGP